jgi:hypothetical protein
MMMAVEMKNKMAREREVVVDLEEEVGLTEIGVAPEAVSAEEHQG